MSVRDHPVFTDDETEPTEVSKPEATILEFRRPSAKRTTGAARRRRNRSS
jgi:hypothetical protein